jgi:hypothetical protein
LQIPCRMTGYKFTGIEAITYFISICCGFHKNALNTFSNGQ